MLADRTAQSRIRRPHQNRRGPVVQFQIGIEFLPRLEDRPADGFQIGPGTTTEKSVVPNFMQCSRQDMLQEPVQKLQHRKSHAAVSMRAFPAIVIGRVKTGQ